MKIVVKHGVPPFDALLHQGDTVINADAIDEGVDAAAVSFDAPNQSFRISRIRDIGAYYQRLGCTGLQL